MRLFLSRKITKPISLEQEKDKEKFYAMLLKMKKNRPDFNIERVMGKVYDDNKIK